jgi:hypothetical protein
LVKRNPSVVRVLDSFSTSVPSSNNGGGGGGGGGGPVLSTCVPTSSTVLALGGFGELALGGFGNWQTDEGLWGVFAVSFIPVLEADSLRVMCYADTYLDNPGIDFDIRISTLDPFTDTRYYADNYYSGFLGSEQARVIQFDWIVSNLFPIGELVDVVVFAETRINPLPGDPGLNRLLLTSVYMDTFSVLGASEECVVRTLERSVM